MRDGVVRWRPESLVPAPQHSDSIDEEGSVRTALVLTSLLVLCVPAVALAADITLIVLVPIAGLVYLVYLLGSDQLVVGVGSALFVLLTFNANVPLVRIPGVEHASVYIFDLLLVPIATVCVWWHRRSSIRIPTLGRAAIGALALFAVWSGLAALVGGGPSHVVGLLFTLEQVRFAVVLFVTTVYVVHTNARCVVYPLLVAVGGHAIIAFAQAINGSPFGLSYLGEGPREVIAQITIGPVVYQAGQHTGGFAGSARVLTGVVILVTPILIAQFVNSKRETLLGLLGASIAGVLVLMSDTDAGLVAFIGVLVLSTGLLETMYWRAAAVLDARMSLVTATTAGITLLLREWSRIATVGERAVAALLHRVPRIGASLPSSFIISGSTRSLEEAGTGSSHNGVVDTSTLRIRLDQYEAALDIAHLNPLFGIGGSNFSIVGTQYGIPAEMSIHNIFFAYLAATGVPGLLLFSASLGSVFVLTVSQSLHAPRDRHLLSIGLLAGLTGYLAYAFWTTMHDNTVAMAVFWAVCGIAVGMSSIEIDS